MQISPLIQNSKREVQNKQKQDSSYFKRIKHHLQSSEKGDKRLKRIDFSLPKQSSKCQPQNPKNLLLKRFTQKRHALQTSSLYVQTGQMKKSNKLPEVNPLISDFKVYSSTRLPMIKNASLNSYDKRAIQTLDGSERNSKSPHAYFDTLNQQNSQTLNSISKEKVINRDRLFSQKRKSLNQSVSEQNRFHSKIQSVDSLNNNSIQISINRRNSSFGFNEQLKKKYLKNIVDRYFPVNQSSNTDNSNFDKYDVIQQNSLELKKKLSFKNSKKLPYLVQKQKIGIRIDLNTTKQFLNNKQSYPMKNIDPKQQQSLQILSQSSQYYQRIDDSPTNISISKSYILQKILEDDEQFQQKKVSQDFYGKIQISNSSFSFLTSSKSFQNLNRNSNQSLIDLIKDQAHQKFPKTITREKRIKIFQNHTFSIYKFKYVTYQSFCQSNKVRVVSVNYELRKYFPHMASLQLKKRQLKAKQIIQSCKGIQSFLLSLWEQDQFDKNCLKLNLSQISPPCSIRTTLPLTLSKLLYKIVPFRQSTDLNYFLIKPSTQPKLSLFLTQQKLLQNNCLGLIKLIKCLAIQLKAVQKQIINNKVSINNVFFIDQNKYTLNQWGYSYFKQDFFIQNKKFQKRLQPILKNQFDQWFVTPEYLAPQILENLLYSPEKQVKYWKKIEGKKMEAKIIKQHDLFEYGNKADVWSLGLLILQIITLIPLWIGDKSIIQNRKNAKISPRKGFLYSQKRDLLKILTKQSYLKQNLQKIIKLQSEPYEIPKWLIQLLGQMIELNPQKRVSLAQILKIMNEYQTKIQKP